MEGRPLGVGKHNVLCGNNVAAGNLLWRMMHLHSKSILWIDDKQWCVYKASHLQSEMGLTKHTFDTAKKVLETMGFAEFSTAGEIGSNKTPATLAFRVTRKAYDAIAKMEVKPQGGISRNPGTGGGGDFPESGNTISRIPGTPHYIQKVDSESSSDSPSAVAVKPTAIQKVFREAAIQRDPEFYDPEWTIKQMGMAKELIRKLADQDVLKIVRTCVQDWDAFAEYVQEKSERRLGERPKLSDLLYHAGEAVEFTRKFAVNCKAEKTASPGKVGGFKLSLGDLG